MTSYLSSGRRSSLKDYISEVRVDRHSVGRADLCSGGSLRHLFADATATVGHEHVIGDGIFRGSLRRR
jgi:hypothetical protein